MGELAVAGDEAAGMMGKGLSTLNAAKSCVVWWFPILEAAAYRAMGKIRERLEWAAIYFAKNACRIKQRKSIQSRTLEGALNNASS